MADTQDQYTRRITRLIPVPGTDIERLLQTSLGLDVWQRTPDALVVRAYEGQLRELESPRSKKTCPPRRSLSSTFCKYAKREPVNRTRSGGLYVGNPHIQN